MSDEPIAERTIRTCKEFMSDGVICPYIKTQRKSKKRKQKVSENQLKLF